MEAPWQQCHPCALSDQLQVTGGTKWGFEPLSLHFIFILSISNPPAPPSPHTHRCFMPVYWFVSNIMIQILKVETKCNFIFQLPPKRSNVFCLVKLVYVTACVWVMYWIPSTWWHAMISMLWLHSNSYYRTTGWMHSLKKKKIKLWLCKRMECVSSQSCQLPVLYCLHCKGIKHNKKNI